MTTLAQVRTMVRERVRISTQDPLFPDAVINRQINIAYGNVLSVQPNGWWWQHLEQTIQNGAADVALFPVRLAANDPTRIIRKVYAVFVSLDGDYWLPVGQRERQDEIRLAGGRRVSDGIPLAWSVVPVATGSDANRPHIALSFDPPLPAFAFVRYICVADNADLTADGSVLVGIPAMLVDLVVETCACAVIRQKRAVGTVTSRRRFATELTIAKTAADGWLKAARVYFNSPAAGPGYATQQIRQ